MALTKSDIRTLVRVLNAFGNSRTYVGFDELDKYLGLYSDLLDHMEEAKEKEKKGKGQGGGANPPKPPEPPEGPIGDPFPPGVTSEDIKARILEEYGRTGMAEITKLIFLISQRYVPVDTGYLRSTGWIEEHDDLHYTIHYDAPYAAKQHETLFYNHTYPGRAKYLEDAAYEVMSFLSDKEPLFTFELGLAEFHDSEDGEDEGGNIWLEINSISTEQFVRNNEIKERIRAFGMEDLEVHFNGLGDK